MYGAGAHKNVRNKTLLNKMNRGAIEGTFYRGRLLVAITAKQLPSAVDGHAAFTQEEASEAAWKQRKWPTMLDKTSYKTKKIDEPLIDKTTKTEFSYWDPIHVSGETGHRCRQLFIVSRNPV